MNKGVPVLSIKDVSMFFGTLEVLRDISFDLYQNEVVAVVGHSGCGKTTLLRIACAFETASKGRILVDDGANHDKPCKDVLMILQSFDQLQPWRTVLGNVMFPLVASSSRFMHGQSGTGAKKRAEIKKQAAKCISDVGLTGFENAYPHTLSGGMKQRAVVALAMALRPKVLLMDEPFASLDDITRGQLQHMSMRIFTQYGISVVIVTHSIEEAIVMADRIIVMSRNPGRIKSIVDNPDKQELSAIGIAEQKERILKIMNE